MSNDAKNIRTGIVIPTKDRADFVIRLLNYYANTKSAHTLYIGDSSNDQEAKKIQAAISKLNSTINIIYNHYPQLNSWQCMISLYSLVKEPYAVYIGDDDYWIPDTLNDCVRFLENNPDYETAIGKSITFKVEANGAYGKLKELHDYYRYPIEGETASERLFDYVGPHLTSIIGAVIKTDKMLKYYQDSFEVPDTSIRGEFLPSCFMVIGGKHKVIDRLGYLRQIHISHLINPDIFHWITKDTWYLSYSLFKNKTANALMAKDSISREKAEQVFKQSMWYYLQKYLPKEYANYVNQLYPPPPRKLTVRNKVAKSFPFLKQIYRNYVRPILSPQKEQLHYEVMQPGSKYYNDFKPIFNSLSNEFRD